RIVFEIELNGRYQSSLGRVLNIGRDRPPWLCTDARNGDLRCSGSESREGKQNYNGDSQHGSDSFLRFRELGSAITAEPENGIDHNLDIRDIDRAGVAAMYRGQDAQDFIDDELDVGDVVLPISIDVAASGS